MSHNKFLHQVDRMGQKEEADRLHVSGGKSFAGETPLKENPKLFPDTVLTLSLATSQAEEMNRFYCDVVGLSFLRESISEVCLGSLGVRRLTLLKQEGLIRRSRGTVGLDHSAYQYQTIEDLAIVANKLYQNHKYSLSLVDHGVSVALYTRDPDGNGVEFVYDRPYSKWPKKEGKLSMYTKSLSIQQLLELHDTDRGPHPNIGHLHFNVSSLRKAKKTFSEMMGMSVTQADYVGALFLAYGDYHHHVGTNIWEGSDAPVPEKRVTGMRAAEFHSPSGEKYRITLSDL